jgi:DNA-binding CsgD family transcriptional regulator
LRNGLELAVRCDASRLAERARDELAASGARLSSVGLTGPESLTPSERRVADLAARGRTNRDIAQSLFISEKTVETHLGHVYDKLGVRSRHKLREILEEPAGGSSAGGTSARASSPVRPNLRGVLRGPPDATPVGSDDDHS